MARSSFERYALYWAPPAGSALARIGAAWLGYDPETGLAVDAPEPEGLPAPRRRLTREAARYGLHATLKAPFRLAEGVGEDVLTAAAAALAARLPPVSAPPLAIDASLGFVALRPSDACPALDALAEACVTQLDLLRAPLTASELHRRRRAGLDMVEDAHLRAWGYPYVLDRFRFHVTLTGPVASTEAKTLIPILEAMFADALGPRFAVDEICLFGDPGAGAPFRLLRRLPLQGA